MTLFLVEKLFTELNQNHYADFANILSSCEDVESADVPLSLSKIAAIIRDEG